MTVTLPSEIYVPRYAERMENVNPSAIRQLLVLGNDPNIISFGGGFPSAELFPVERLAEAFAQSFAESGKVALQYTATSGILPLREEVARMAQRDGMVCTPEDVLILQGGQQGLDLVCKMLINKNDKIVVENPTFLGGLAAFNPYQPSYLPVTADSEGLNTEELAETLRQNPDVKFIYVVPDFNNPTGITMSLPRRQKLVALARQYNILILEDTPYRALRYSGEHLPTLYSLCHSHVVHLSSFSKVLAPGLRVGYAIAGRAVLDKLNLLKLAADTQNSTINQVAVVNFLKNNDLPTLVETYRTTYRRKRDTMIRAIKREWPSCIKHTTPEGGLFLWVEWPKSFDSTAFLANYAIPVAGVAYVPGLSFFAGGDQINHGRFSFSSTTEDKIDEGITKLGAIFQKWEF